jgi:hypothetical protein
MAERHPPDEGMVSGATHGPKKLLDTQPRSAGGRRASGSHLDPEPVARTPRASRHTPGSGKHIQPSFPSDRGPQGDHLANWNESDTVEPVATRKGSPADTSSPL